MFFFQIPTPLPMDKQSNKGKEKIGTSTVSGEATKSKNALEELPRGYMGKMLVYKSGAIKSLFAFIIEVKLHLLLQ